MKYRYREPHEMKDSGVEWLGMIPKEWKVINLRYCLREKIVDGPHETPIYKETGVPFISVDSLSDSEIVDLEIVKKFISEEKYNEYNKKTKLRKNDLLFSKSATIGKVAIVDERKFMTWSPLAIIKYNDLKVKYKNLFYILKCNRYIEYIKSLSNLNTQLNIGMGLLEKSKISISHKLYEQQKIADFLDKKCEEFDSVIAKKEILINKLEEAKKSLISEVVTGKVKVIEKENGEYGIIKREDHEMKDSGVEWLGMIPKEWTRIKLKYMVIVKARLGWKGLKAEEYVEDGYIFLATPNIKSENIDFKNVNYITKERYDESPEIKLEIGDILLTKDGSTLGTVNRIKFLPKEATVNSSIAILRIFKNFNYNYLYYLIKSQGIQDIINYFKGGMGVPHLFQSDIKNFDLLLPSFYKEQQKIVCFLDEKISRFNLIIDKERQLIEQLKLAKQSLISEAVTGKLEVL